MSLNIPDKNDLCDYSPLHIAQTIFNKPYQPPKSYCILNYDENSNVSIMFEILLTIYMEGINILLNGWNNLNLDELSEDLLFTPNPWFNSLGFKLNIFEINKNLTDFDFYKNYYCKIKLKLDEPVFFEMKNIDNDYHFVINGDFYHENKNENNIENLFAIYIYKNKIYQIQFGILF